MIALLLLLLFPVSLSAQTYAEQRFSDVRIVQVPGVELKRNDPAPDDGAFFSGQSAISLLEALRDLKAYRAQLDILSQETKLKDEQIANLEKSKQSADLAIFKAEFIISKWQLIDDTRKIVTEEYRIALTQLRETNDQLVKSLTATENKAWWDRVWSTIMIVAVGAFGFIH
jgi:hypothetical protein